MIEIIPAIDLINGRCVRLEQGDFSKIREYDYSPLDMALWFESHGLRRIHVVDLDGAKSEKTNNLNILESIKQNTALEIDFGGGIRTSEQISKAFDAGADYLTIGSMAINSPVEFGQIMSEKGPDRFILAADWRDGKVATHGWTKKSSLEIEEFIESYASLGIREVMCTDISKDGMLSGVDIDFYKKLKTRFMKLSFIASGGVSRVEDIQSLARIGIEKVIIGKAFYENRLDFEQLKNIV
jgi:phosphoribosylformimino-5-aminoimidazole carboxamide ribotide isomerase